MNGTWLKIIQKGWELAPRTFIPTVGNGGVYGRFPQITVCRIDTVFLPFTA
jgi:hypothetical protein